MITLHCNGAMIRVDTEWSDQAEGRVCMLDIDDHTYSPGNAGVYLDRPTLTQLINALLNLAEHE